MYDRKVEHPNRYQMVKVEGTDDIYDLVPAPGTVNNEGTLINKNSLLKDATAALFGMGADAVPDDMFAAIKSVLNAHESSILSGPKIETGSYVGTGTYGVGNHNTIAFEVAPEFVFVSGAGYLAIFTPKGPGCLCLSGKTTILINVLEWIGNTMSWRSNASAANQLNISGREYFWIAVR